MFGDDPAPHNATVVVRVWLPDRPGALGAVASRIGAVRGDVVAIDVLERGGGRAVDELTVALADGALVDLLVAEIGQVDGVDVEDVRPAISPGRDRAVLALEAARSILSAPPEGALVTVCHELRALVGADWVGVLDPEHGAMLAVSGDGAPEGPWLAAFLAGAAARPDGHHGGVDELAFSPIAGAGHLVVSRAHLPLRTAERSMLAELAAICELRLASPVAG